MTEKKNLVLPVKTKALNSVYNIIADQLCHHIAKYSSWVIVLISVKL